MTCTKKYKIIYLLITILIIACVEKNNKKVMKDNLDLFLLEQNAEKIPMDNSGKFFFYQWEFIADDDTEIQIKGNKINGFVELQIPPKPAFFKIYKEYYPNGDLKIKGKRMGTGATMVGEWEYYDENGQLAAQKNEDEKFGKFGHNELLLFLAQQGHINLETGENREKADFGYNSETKQWEVYVTSLLFWITEYIIDGETGEVISKKEYQGGIE